MDLQASIVLESNPDAIIFPELDFAFMGTVRRCGSSDVVAYNFAELSKRTDLMENSNPLWESPISENSPVFVQPMTLEEFADRHPDTQVWLGLDDAFIGVCFQDVNKPNSIAAVFSYEKCVKIREKEIEESDLELSEDETERSVAIEDLEFNTLGAYIGEDTPFHLENEVETVDTY